MRDLILRISGYEIMIEDKEFRKRIKELPFRRRINYDELAYARSDSGKVYALSDPFGFGGDGDSWND